MSKTLSLCLGRGTRALRMQGGYLGQGEGGIKSSRLRPGDRRRLYFFCLAKIGG
ncbi:hypothetical protein SAMN04488082_1371 [Desulfomicrobium apsheronum]|uniref:Uncharacterized protein n=1 Tax=Desulfomicrobium apsheronum TaxID=52560 RepID=A0A1I4AEH1_9BACT|nr:hypothetical protein [Desulfomicrobium apsheronum]SFK54808.1 hypothetical protein SAMN04488082_1371 [Desulfomicrobium apsheronum]